MKTKIALLFLVLILIACSKENHSIDIEHAYSYADFEKNLKSGMDYNSIIVKFGVPSKDIGRGIHIYVYKLIDSTEVWIGYADKILYATHLDKSHKIINSIIDGANLLTCDYFNNNLKSNMDFNSITAKFGVPSKDIGSGIHIYVYELIDSSEVWIGYTDKILYAKHMDINHVLLEDLIK